MNKLVDTLFMLLGSLCLGTAVWFIAHLTLSQWWTRQWVLSRLGGTSHQIPLPKQFQQSSVSDFLDAIAREVHSGYSLTLAFVNTAERFPNLAWWTEPISLQCLRGHSLATAIADTAQHNWTSEVALATRTLSVAPVTAATALSMHSRKVHQYCASENTWRLSAVHRPPRFGSLLQCFPGFRSLFALG